MKAKHVIIIILTILMATALFFFLKNVFSGNLIVRDYLFAIGPSKLRWYSLCIACGILTSYFLARRRLKLYSIPPEALDEALILGIIFGIIGARTYYVIFNWSYYSRYPSEIIKVWHGGLAIHGAIIGAILSTYLYTKITKKFKFIQGLDLLTSVLPLGQAIGRWGNFFNYEAYGSPTNLPWKMYVPPEKRMPGFESFEYFHPTFLYESIANFLIFLFLYFYTEKKKKNYGETTALYFILYSIVRFIIESLRLDALRIGTLRTAQVVSIILAILGAVWYGFLRGRSSKLS